MAFDPQPLQMFKHTRSGSRLLIIKPADSDGTVAGLDSSNRQFEMSAAALGRDYEQVAFAVRPFAPKLSARARAVLQEVADTVADICPAGMEPRGIDIIRRNCNLTGPQAEKTVNMLLAKQLLAMWSPEADRTPRLVPTINGLRTLGATRPKARVVRR